MPASPPAQLIVFNNVYISPRGALFAIFFGAWGEAHHAYKHSIKAATEDNKVLGASSYMSTEPFASTSPFICSLLVFPFFGFFFFVQQKNIPLFSPPPRYLMPLMSH